MALTAPRLRALHRAEHIGGAFKGGVKVCQRQLVEEVLGPLVTEFVRNFGRESATPTQRGSNASLLGRVWAVKLMRHKCAPRCWGRSSLELRCGRRLRSCDWNFGLVRPRHLCFWQLELYANRSIVFMYMH